MISHKCYSNPHVLMMRSKASKDSSRGFQVSSEISFLISVRKTLPTSGQTLTWHPKIFWFGHLNVFCFVCMIGYCRQVSGPNIGHLQWSNGVLANGVAASQYQNKWDCCFVRALIFYSVLLSVATDSFLLSLFIALGTSTSRLPRGCATRRATPRPTRCWSRSRC